MGHRDSPAPLGGGIAVHAARSGVAGSGAGRVAELAEESAAAAPRDAALNPPDWKARILLGVIGAYQAVLSPHMVSPCKFHPTCSRYAAEAIRTHGARRGAWLALRRLARCHPFGPGGFDPVPDRIENPTSHAVSGADETQP
ncbi:MAG: membrane protein insertion efficiency factor YidD [Candidatus Acidiferrales bacterium]